MPADDDRKICHNCVGETYLSKLIEADGEVALCHYCDYDDEKCIPIEELADHIEGAFERHYYRTSDQPDMYESMLLRDKELHYEWDRLGEPVLEAIAEAASIEAEAAQDVLDILEDRHGDFESAQMGDECEFDSDTVLWRVLCQQKGFYICTNGHLARLRFDPRPLFKCQAKRKGRIPLAILPMCHGLLPFGLQHP